MSAKIKRRSLVKGAAWETPIVLASAAVPAYAASPVDEEQCPDFVIKPGSIFGKFSLTLPTDTERMDIFVQDGTLDKAVFSKPQWYLTSDSKIAYWVPGLHSYNDPTVTVELSITPDENGKINATFDVYGCDSLIFDGTTVSKLR